MRPEIIGCGKGATPEVRRQLLGLAIAVLAPAVLPCAAGAQNTASGSVRLVIRADALPAAARRVRSQPVHWMAPESVEETERVAALWASGDDEGALGAWQAVLRKEIAAERLLEMRQAGEAADWIAERVLILASRGREPDPRLERRAREVRAAAWAAARASGRGRIE